LFGRLNEQAVNTRAQAAQDNAPRCRMSAEKSGALSRSLQAMTVGVALLIERRPPLPAKRICTAAKSDLMLLP
jgi:hypothetical protein